MRDYEKEPRRPRGTIDERFATFNADYPQVYRLIQGFARDIKRRGFKHYGINAIVNRARWEVAMTWGPDSEQGFKMNNDFAPLYARRIMDDFPGEFGGFFRVRRRRAVGSEGNP